MQFFSFSVCILLKRCVFSDFKGNFDILGIAIIHFSFQELDEMISLACLSIKYEAAARTLIA